MTAAVLFMNAMLSISVFSAGYLIATFLLLWYNSSFITQSKEVGEGVEEKQYGGGREVIQGVVGREKGVCGVPVLTNQNVSIPVTDKTLGKDSHLHVFCCSH